MEGGEEENSYLKKMNEYTLKLSDEATEDVQEVFMWYESQSLGLGVRFIDYLDNALQRIKKRPFSFVGIEFLSYRRIFLQTFPYKVYYLV